MKTLKIEIPEGYEIDKEQSTFESIVFKKIKKELPKSWGELNVLHGYYVNPNSYVSEILRGKPQGDDMNTFATKEQAKASIALAQLSQLREVYRQGWVPDWKDNMQDKFGICCFANDLRLVRSGEYNYFLSFESQAIAQEFLNNFRELIEQAKPLMR